MKLEDKLIELRRNCGYTQQEVADLLHVERSTYAGYETGKATIPIRKIQLLAVIYHVDLNSFNTSDNIILHSPDCKEEVEAKEEDEIQFHLTRDERMMVAMIRMVRAMGRGLEFDQMLLELYNRKP